MVTMVFDVPASSGGALSILEEYHRKALRDTHSANVWYFVVSLPHLSETVNVKVLRFPWVKKSWFHRLYFELFVAPRLVAKYNPDRLLSLQSLTIPRVRVYQILYVHQPMPFSGVRFGLFDDWLLWFYQRVFGRQIIRSVQRADEVIVQTNWMKHACVERARISPSKVRVVPPTVDIDVRRCFAAGDKELSTFFYPASGVIYKNHKAILGAVTFLEARGVKDYTVMFTLKGNESKHVRGIFRQVQRDGLPIKFIGHLTRDQVFEYYSRSVLLFPSYVETFGLPLLEARMHGTPVLASDCPFSREILQGYKNAWFFDPNDEEMLAQLMMQVMSSGHS